MVYIITPVDKFYTHMILIEKRKSESARGERDFMNRWVRATMNQVICENGGSTYDAGHKQVK